MWKQMVGFSEDASRKRAGNSSQNHFVLLKIALNLLKNKKTKSKALKVLKIKV